MTLSNLFRRSSNADAEKEVVGIYENVPLSDLPPDPDTHLSAEEKAAIVSQ